MNSNDVTDDQREIGPAVSIAEYTKVNVYMVTLTQSSSLLSVHAF